MHYYGPYSHELDGVLSLSESLGYVNITPDQDGWGFHVTPRDTSRGKLSEMFDITEESRIEAIDRTIQRLGDLETPELELRATIHFVGGPKTNRSEHDTVKIVRRLKPRFTEEQVRFAYQDLKSDGLMYTEPLDACLSRRPGTRAT